MQHPDATEVVLASARGGSGDNFGTGIPPAATTNTVFDDEAATPISSGSAPFAGTYRPDGTLSTFDGKTVSGNWRFRVTDGYPAGSNAVLSAASSRDWLFASWSGDTNGCAVAGAGITAPMTRTRSLTAAFRPIRTTLILLR